MSIFGTIMSKVFGHHADAAPAPVPSAGAAPSAGSSAAAAPTSTSSDAPEPPSAPNPSAAPAQTVDVGAVLDGMAAKAGQKLNWKVSIVDLMKLLGMDSSFAARKELAHELGYTGDTNDSATMNIWLHKQVMTKFAENGGKLPPDLKH